MVKRRGMKAWVIVAIAVAAALQERDRGRGRALGGCHCPVRDAGGR
jgi:hypothetical protein